MRAPRFVHPTHFAPVANSAAGLTALNTNAALVNANMAVTSVNPTAMFFVDTLPEGTIVTLSNSTPGADFRYLIVKSSPSTPTSGGARQIAVALA